MVNAGIMEGSKQDIDSIAVLWQGGGGRTGVRAGAPPLITSHLPLVNKCCFSRLWSVVTHSLLSLPEFPK